MCSPDQRDISRLRETSCENYKTKHSRDPVGTTQQVYNLAARKIHPSQAYITDSVTRHSIAYSSFAIS